MIGTQTVGRTKRVTVQQARSEIAFRNAIALEIVFRVARAVFVEILQGLRNTISRTSAFPSTTWERAVAGSVVRVGNDPVRVMLSVLSTCQTDT